MARGKILAVLVVPLVVLAGCSAFFDYNAFASLDATPSPKTSDYEGLGGLAKLSTDLSSPAVVAQLKADPTTTQQIESYLLASYLSGGIATPDQQQAAILYSDLYLETTSGEELVNNTVASVVSGIAPSTTIQDLLGQILPPEAKADPGVFSSMIKAFRLSNIQYLALGAGIVDVNGNGKIDTGEGVPPGTNMGDVAQKAGVAYTVEVIYRQMQAALPSFTEDQLISQMYLLATDPAKADPAVQALAPDPYDAASTDPYVMTNLPNVQKIFDCAGTALPA